jgi:Ni2+-binding GTPase involved in maturation of urease and hydrogenase
METFVRDFRGLNPHASLIEVSCRTGQGIDDFVDWVTARIERRRAANIPR